MCVTAVWGKLAIDERFCRPSERASSQQREPISPRRTRDVIRRYSAQVPPSRACIYISCRSVRLRGASLFFSRPPLSAAFSAWLSFLTCRLYTVLWIWMRVSMLFLSAIGLFFYRCFCWAMICVIGCIGAWVCRDFECSLIRGHFL